MPMTALYPPSSPTLTRSLSRPGLPTPMAEPGQVLHPDLRPAENHSLKQGAWFAGLSPELRRAPT